MNQPALMRRTIGTTLDNYFAVLLLILAIVGVLPSYVIYGSLVYLILGMIFARLRRVEGLVKKDKDVR